MFIVMDALIGLATIPRRRAPEILEKSQKCPLPLFVPTV
jgi:hypothetical protein